MTTPLPRLVELLLAGRIPGVPAPQGSTTAEIRAVLPLSPARCGNPTCQAWLGDTRYQVEADRAPAGQPATIVCSPCAHTAHSRHSHTVHPLTTDSPALASA